MRDLATADSESRRAAVPEAEETHEEARYGFGEKQQEARFIWVLSPPAVCASRSLINAQPSLGQIHSRRVGLFLQPDLNL